MLRRDRLGDILQEDLQGGKVKSRSGGSFLDAEQICEDRPNNHLPVDPATAGHSVSRR